MCGLVCLLVAGLAEKHGAPSILCKRMRESALRRCESAHTEEDDESEVFQPGCVVIANSDSGGFGKVFVIVVVAYALAVSAE